MQPPILFIHAAFSRGAHFAPWVRFFEAAGFDCRAPSLPAHDPPEPDKLRDHSIESYFAAILALRQEMTVPPIVIGHSMGGLLGQMLAAATPTAALVCLASVPPGVLWAQPRALPYLARLLPTILTGGVMRPSNKTNRELIFHDLPEAEQQQMIADMGPDAGRAYRSMIFGTVRIPRGRVRCPVLCISGGADRIVSNGISKSIAARYHAEHHVFPDRGHWLIAESATNEIAPVVLRWLRKTGHASGEAWGALGADMPI